MRHVRIEGGVAPHLLTATDIATGRVITNVVGVDIRLRVGEMNSAVLWVAPREGELEAEAVAVTVDVEVEADVAPSDVGV